MHSPFKVTFTFALTALIGLMMSGRVLADDSLKSKAKEAGNDTSRAAKKGVRAVKDKTCEMINGKMECAGQKVKHSIQNGADKIEDAVE